MSVVINPAVASTFPVVDGVVAASVLVLFVSDGNTDIVKEVVDVEGALIVVTVDGFGITAGLFVVFGVRLKFVVKKVKCIAVFTSTEVFSVNSEVVVPSGTPVLTAEPCSVELSVANVSKSVDVDANLVDDSKAPSSWPVVTFISFKVVLKSVTLVPLVIPASDDKGISVLFTISNVDDSYLTVLNFSIASESVILVVLSQKVLTSVFFATCVAISVSKFLTEPVLVMISPLVTIEVVSKSTVVAFSVVKLASKSVASIEMSVLSAKSNLEEKLL